MRAIIYYLLFSHIMIYLYNWETKMNIDKFNTILENVKEELFRLIESEMGVSDYDKIRVKNIFEGYISTNIYGLEEIKKKFNLFCNNILKIEKAHITKNKGAIEIEGFQADFYDKKNIFKLITYIEPVRLYSLTLNQENEIFLYVDYDKMNINSCFHVLSVTKNNETHKAMWAQEDKFYIYLNQTILNEMLNEDIKLKKDLLLKIKRLKEIHFYFVNPLYNTVDVDFKMNINKVKEEYKHLLEIDINKYKPENIFEIKDLILINCDIDILKKVNLFSKNNLKDIKHN